MELTNIFYLSSFFIYLFKAYQYLYMLIQSSSGAVFSSLFAAAPRGTRPHAPFLTAWGLVSRSAAKSEEKKQGQNWTNAYLVSKN